MKKIFLFISLLGIFGSGIFSPSVLLASESTLSQETTFRDLETMALHGLFATGQIRSYSCPFEVTETSPLITVYYPVSLSNICVTAVNDFGVDVYFNKVDLIANTELYTDSSSWKAGAYTLSFTDSLGNCIYKYPVSPLLP